MPVPKFQQTRLDNLEKNLDDGENLLAELRKSIEIAPDPLSKRRYQADIDHVTQLRDTWQAEYFQVYGQINSIQTQTSDPTVNAQLTRIVEKLDTIQKGVENAKVEILAEVRITKEALLSKYDTTQQDMLKAIFERLDQDQIETLAAINDKLDDKALKGSAVEADYHEVTQALTVIEQSPDIKPEVKAEIVKVKAEAEAQKSDNGVKSGLKLALPLIPGLLDINADTANLKAAALSVNLGFVKGDVKLVDAVNVLKGVWAKFRTMTNKQPATP